MSLGQIIPLIEFNDILIVRMANESQLDWMRRLPKRQEGIWEPNMIYSFGLLQRKDTLFFLYNDHRFNHLDENPSILKQYGGGETANLLVRVTKDGQVDKFNISRKISPQKRLAVHPRRSWQLDDNQVLLYAEAPGQSITSGMFFTMNWEELLHKN